MGEQERPVQLRYFAILREQRGIPAETVTTGARTARDLYADLAVRHGFTLPADRVTVAINDTYRAMDTPIAANDTVVFIPPVAGG